MQRRRTSGQIAWLVEVGLIGWFFVQAVRFLLGAVYAHVSSADIVLRLGVPAADTAGVILPAVAQAEVMAVGVAVVLPVLAFLLGSRPILFAVSAAAVAVGRVFMTIGEPLTAVVGAGVVAAGGALYLAAAARQRPTWFATTTVLGLLVDQIVRAAGTSYDPTWTESFLPVQTALSIVLFVLVVIRVVSGDTPPFKAAPAYSGIALGGGTAFGALLFLEMAVFSLPNAVAHWTGVSYAAAAPWLAAVTALTLIPEARDIARRVLSLVDAQWRGWFWLSVVSLMVVIGNRFSGPLAAVVLVAGQFMIMLCLWWIVRPVPQDGRDVTGGALVVSFVVLVVLFAGDFFTYEYAFVRDFGGTLDFLSQILRRFRGLGLGVILAGVALTTLPMMEAKRRIPWQRGDAREFAAGVAAVFGAAVLVTLFSLPADVEEKTGNDRLRVATYNIHGGYSLYFDYNLTGIADTIWESGADIVLLQEVDAGRLVSYGVDQALWLGRRLGMHVRYFPTNETLQGLAVLSRVPVTLDSGTLLSSQGMQTGVQRVQIRPDEGVLDLYNTWLGLLYARDSVVLSLQEQDQWQQLQEVLAVISLDHPGGVVGRVILGGTLNNTPDSPIYERLVDVGFSDPFDGLPAERSATLLRGEAITARFDYLWLRNVLPTGRGVLESDASDHRLAIVEINLAQ